KLGDAEDDVERLEILSQLVEIYEARLKDPARAFERSRAAFEIAPTDDVRQAEVERLAGVTGDWPSLVASYRVAIRQSEQTGETGEWQRYAEVIERRLELDVDDQEVIDLKFRLAEAQREHLNQADNALATYREVLALSPTHEGARLALEGWLGDSDLRGAAAQ